MTSEKETSGCTKTNNPQLAEAVKHLHKSMHFRRTVFQETQKKQGIIISKTSVKNNGKKWEVYFLGRKPACVVTEEPVREFGSLVQMDVMYDFAHEYFSALLAMWNPSRLYVFLREGAKS
ncbi:hypothetical protein CEXT_704331 [Caerostris extrusa]|uniref:Transposase n=1 Tax=Caerostris extrusa TaxID=172846 RepID=A0AAV4QB74_CAEEX|nr:hypothetical protein CEXT_704331 [Caerostris extrusa]